MWTVRHLILAMALVALPAWAWFGPSAEDPYALVVTPMDEKQKIVPTWQWQDARANVELENRQTRDGYMFGDAVFKPRPFDYVQAEFVRQVALHDERDALLEKLAGKTIRLLELEADVGLRVRLSERQSGRWETVRIRGVIALDDSRYEATDVHSFNNSEKPSPANAPMREVVKSWVNQILLF